MDRFWRRFVRPLLAAAAPSRVLQVGAGEGGVAHRLIEMAGEQGFALDIVEPRPDAGLRDRLAGPDARCTLHVAGTLAVMALVPAPDFVLLDGERNWYTVYNELTLSFLRAHVAGRDPPIVLIPDVAWPYARRDCYVDVSGIPELERHPFARRGVLPGSSALSDAGLHGMHYNALHEGGVRNGVLTAVEDFIAASGLDVVFRQLALHNGLGILVPQPRATAAVRATLDSFFTISSVRTSLDELQAEATALQIALGVCQTHLTRRTEALMRARAVINDLQQPQN